jgi:hypothetical protein
MRKLKKWVPQGRNIPVPRPTGVSGRETCVELYGWLDVWDSVSRSATCGAEPLEDKFKRLATLWKSHAMFHSSPEIVRSSPGYSDLVAMDVRVVPLILAELDVDPFYWFDVLSELTGVDPIPLEHAGDVDAMIDAWKAWARDNHYLLYL